MPNASQCPTSTCAPDSGEQALFPISETWNLRFRSRPAFTKPSVGSERISERLSLSSTKQGPSVRAGRTTQDGRMSPLEGVKVDGLISCSFMEKGGVQAASKATLPIPRTL